MLALAVALVVTAPAPAPAAAGPAPGVVSQAPLAERDFARMGRGGVETLRHLVRWRELEPERGSYDFSSLDAVAAGAARRRLELLPVVYGSPPWVAADERHPPLGGPAERAAWRAFLRRLVDRYGRGGEFWSGRARRAPVTRWQVWNEPNFDLYWHPRPDPAAYARLLAISADAIRARDRRSRIVLAGVAAVRHGIPWWSFLRRLYRRPGFRRDFDLLALHPYAPGIRLLRRQVELARSIAAAAGDRSAPLAITEVGWASAGPPTPLVRGRRGQARLLTRAFRLFDRRARRWRVSDVQWYAWQDAVAVEPDCAFCAHAGLFDGAGRAKPAWPAFRRAARRMG